MNPHFQQRNDVASDGSPTIVFFIENQFNNVRLSIRGPGHPLLDVGYPTPPYNEWHHYAVTVHTDAR